MSRVAAFPAAVSALTAPCRAPRLGRRSPNGLQSRAGRRLGASLAIASALAFGSSLPASAQDLCQGFGPQSPRDIANPSGSNSTAYSFAPPASALELCNIHTHTNAEHKGPGFSILSSGEQGGYQCNESAELAADELEDPSHGHGAYHGVKPGDSIEVHWVYTSCDIEPGKGLGACVSQACANPELRVEAQVFLLVNDPDALDFADFAYAGNHIDGRAQPRALPANTGTPVVYAGSTTGPSYTQTSCSPYQVTWSVRPLCAKLDIASLHRWAEAHNVFEEEHSHDVRQLVTAPELLAPIR